MAAALPNLPPSLTLQHLSTFHNSLTSRYTGNMDTDITLMSSATDASLWKNRDFVKLWVGQAVSQIGSRLTREGLPLGAVIALGASPIQMGWLEVVGTLPVTVLGLVTGALLDRMPRRPFLIATDVLRFAVLMAVPLTAWFGHLSMWLLFVVKPLVDVLTLVFNSAYQAYLPRLVERAQILRANSVLSMTRSFAEMTGPGLAGILVQWLNAPVAIFIDALTYLFSAAAVGLIRRQEPARPFAADPATPTFGSAPPTQKHLLREIRDGLRVLRNHRILRAITLTAGTVSLFEGTYFSMDVLFAMRDLHLPAGLFGITVCFGGLGALVGAAVTPRLARRVGTGPWLVASGLLMGVFNLLMPSARGPAWEAALFLMGAQVLGDFCGVSYGAVETTVRQLSAPDEVLGRLTSVYNLLASVLFSVGAVLGGYAATWLGLRTALYFAAAGMGLAALWLLTAPILRIREGSA